jgi:glycerol-3-phosphate dehydrogenase (NAD(P)+)
MSLITIIGAGMMGSAMSYPATDNGHTVRIVGTPLDREIIDCARETGMHKTLKRKLPEGIAYYQIEELDEAISGADLLIGGVSSFGVDWFRENVIPHVPDGVPVLSITKGMWNAGKGELRSFPELYRESTDRPISFCAVGGPCTSYELADRDPTEVTFCGENPEELRWIRSLLQTSYYNISLSTDVRGVECAVAMKNAYALAVSLAIGESYHREGREFEHYNSQAALFAQSVREMERLLAFCQGHPSNLALGAGDLYVTVFGGRTRKIGTLLGQGDSFEKAMDQLSGITLESVVIAGRTVRAVEERVEMGTVKAEDFPLLLHVARRWAAGGPDGYDNQPSIPWKAFTYEFF